MIEIAIPYHDHLCPGLKSDSGFMMPPHRRHVYPCHNPKCINDRYRYCGIIVDAIYEHRRGPKRSLPLSTHCFLEKRYL